MAEIGTFAFFMMSRCVLVQGIAIPTHTMFTEDYIKEAVVDNVLSKSGVLTFADLGINPQRIDVGLPIEHVRYFRVGGAARRWLHAMLS